MKIIGLQQDVMISAAATAVGINMTFFMPFVLLRRNGGVNIEDLLSLICGQPFLFHIL